MPTLTVDCELPETADALLARGRLQVTVPSFSLSVAELIAQTVQTQMLLKRSAERAKVEAHQATDRLSDEAISAGMAEGRIAISKPLRLHYTGIEPQEQEAQIQCEVARAQKEFMASAYQVFIDGDLHRNLETRIELTEDSQVLFLRLVPLVGG